MNRCCNCLSGRSIVERRLVFVVAGLSLVLVCFIISLVVITLPKKSSLDKKIPVCETERCKAAAEYILSSIDRSADPCQDFYSFACDTWRAVHNSSVEVRSLMNEDAARAALSILRDTQLTKESPKSLKNAVNFYKMCNNATRKNKRGLNPVRNSLDRLGGWPAIVDNWNSDDYDWMAAEVTTLLWTGRSFLVGFTVALDPRNISIPVIQLGVINSRGATNTTDYIDSVRNVLRYIDDRKDYQQEALDIVSFEIELMEAYDAMQEEPKVLTISELEAETNSSFWEGYLKLVANQTSMTVTRDSEIVTNNLSYLKKLGEIMKFGNSSRLVSRRIANFLGWKFLLFSWYLLPDVIIDQIQPPIEVFRREAACFEFVKSTFVDILSHVYVKNSFDLPTKDKARL